MPGAGRADGRWRLIGAPLWRAPRQPPCASRPTRLYSRSAPSEEMQKGFPGGSLAYTCLALAAGTSVPSARPLAHHTSSWCISGGSAVTDNELRGQIRASLSEARLPAVDGVSRSSRGTGRPCVVCHRAIEPTEVERQAGGLGVFLYAHEACYKLWREESVVFRATKDRTKGP